MKDEISRKHLLPSPFSLVTGILNTQAPSNLNMTNDLEPRDSVPLRFGFLVFCFLPIAFLLIRVRSVFMSL